MIDPTVSLGWLSVTSLIPIDPTVSLGWLSVTSLIPMDPTVSLGCFTHLGRVWVWHESATIECVGTFFRPSVRTLHSVKTLDWPDLQKQPVGLVAAVARYKVC